MTSALAIMCNGACHRRTGSWTGATPASLSASSCCVTTLTSQVR